MSVAHYGVPTKLVGSHRQNPLHTGPSGGFGRDVDSPPGSPDVASRRRTPSSPSPSPLRTDPGRDGTTGVVTSPGDRLSQALKGGSGSVLAASTLAVTTVDAWAHVLSDLVFRRARSFRNFFSPEGFLVKNSLTLRMLAANNWKASSTLWAATPRMRRRSGSSTASLPPSLMKPFIPSFEFRRVA